jgi:triacylglycerol lipase
MKHVRKFVTLCAPHHGTITASLRNRPGAKQMRRRSAFLLDLNADAASLRQVGFTGLWTPTDLIILPARSSEVAHAQNVRIWGIGHVTFILEKRGIRKVIEVLE